MKHKTRRRIIALLLAYLTLAFALAAFHLVNVVSLHDKSELVEEYYLLFNSVLEVRRYEKNYIIYRDEKDLLEADRYLQKSRVLADELSDSIQTISSKADYDKFMKNISAYAKILNQAITQNNTASYVDAYDDARVRGYGKQMVDFSHELLMTKRKRIKDALQLTLTVPLAFLVIVSVLLVLVGHLVSRNIIRPLNIIRRTTDEVAKGNFEPIPYPATGDDEVSALVTAFNRMAREIDERQEQLVQTRKIAAIGTFTSGVAHELNNPINNIRITAETLLDDLENLNSAEVAELSLDILSQADRASDIVKNLLEFSREDQPGTAEFSIKDVLESTFKLVRNQIMVDGVKLHSEIPDELPRIAGSLRNLQQVFLNLLLNAVQAMPGGGDLNVEACQEGDMLRIDVTDTGTGILPEDLEHIFDPFYTTKEVGQGTGLGLSVTYGLVKKHGGYIVVDSTVGQGSTFTVFLPFVEDAEEEV